MKFKVGDKVRFAHRNDGCYGFISKINHNGRCPYLVAVIEGDQSYGWYFEESLKPYEEYKTGDTVWVRDGDECDWVKRVFVCEYEGGYWVIKHPSGQFYPESTSASLLKWKQIKPLEEKLDIALTCTVNGEEVPLSDISEETLLAIRNKSK